MHIWYNGMFWNQVICIQIPPSPSLCLWSHYLTSLCTVSLFADVVPVQGYLGNWGNTYNTFRAVLKAMASIQYSDYNRMMKREKEAIPSPLKCWELPSKAGVISRDLTYFTRACFQGQRHNYKENLWGCGRESLLDFQASET